MSDEIEYSDEFVNNFLDNVFELWFNDALEEKRLEREDFEKGQVFLKNPFALSQGSYRTERNSSVRITASRRCQDEYVISDGLRRDASASC